MTGPLPLSKTQCDVIRLLADGLSYEDIGRKLDLKFDTVKTHLKRARQRTDTHTGAGLVAYALRTGQIT